MCMAVSMSMTVSMCVAVSVSVAVSVASFHVSHKFLHHQEGDNPTENPQPHRENGALAAVGVSVSRLLRSMVRMRLQGVRDEVEERITQEPPRSKAQQDLEQRAVPGRVRFHRDEEQHEERSCGDQNCGPQRIGPEGDSVQMVLDARSPGLPRGSVAMFVGMSMSSVVEAIVGVPMAVAMVHILM